MDTLSLYEQRLGRRRKFVDVKYSTESLTERSPILGVKELFYRLVESGRIDVINTRQSSYHGGIDVAMSISDKQLPSPKYMDRSQAYAVSQQVGDQLEEQYQERRRKLDAKAKEDAQRKFDEAVAAEVAKRESNRANKDTANA